MLVALLSSLVLTTQATPAPTVERSTAGTENSTRRVCRREQVLGSNRTQTVCMTERERLRRRDNAERNLDRIRETGGTPDEQT
ncbi:hypothetical protein ACIQC9_06395 [Brevundimonas sp. NPDC092305]|uniref:hypothetical protein n=1 Tax=Brevundimonas sp. NPDC092305 TaxID=3363957 RepID=UPI0038256B9F